MNVFKRRFKIVFPGRLLEYMLSKNRLPREPVEYILSRRGNCLLKDQLGYIYQKDNVRKNGVMYWRCTKYQPKYGSCKASVHTIDGIVVRRKSDHNHLAENTD